MARSGLGNITPKPRTSAKKEVRQTVRGKHGRNQPVARDKRVGVSVNGDELQQLRLWAAEKGVSMAELLRLAAWETLGDSDQRENFLNTVTE